jgi:hypothetical protein
MTTPKLSSERAAAVCSLLVTHRPGSQRLDGHPLLAYAPEQRGHFEVGTEDNGTRVSAIVAAYNKTPDLQAVAAQYKTTAAHVSQALDYALGVEPA